MLEIALHGPARAHPVGRQVPVTVTVRNTSRDVVWAAGVLDGSEDGVRYPRYLPSVLRDGRPVAGPPAPEDPLVGPLRPGDFRRLAPGESFDPTGHGFLPLTTFTTYAPDLPGRYLYGLSLSTESDTPEDWLGRFGQGEERAAVLELVKRVPRLTVTSVPLEVVVE
ncbi:hypothetical protein [Streptomyces daliensis]|uniref:Uncharacterized protein n=1 Tax=Streptomyces daliensis TaxID=299421 RepID=A0A8T4IVR2_9ACTN|nr:hypothetical protein [Streptomyces daliensis]